MQLILNLFSQNTIYASIAPDGDDGLIFYWRAGDSSIEIDVLEPDQYYWRVVDRGGEISLTGEDDELPLIELKHAVKIFSKEVDQVNPHWRESFR